ncbi:hypothetical protein [Streptomyces sp. 7N604]
MLPLAVGGTDDEATASISQLRDLTRSGDYAYYIDIAHFIGRPPSR